MSEIPNRGGRPRKGEAPRVPYEEVDRILVFGEVVPCEDGNGTAVAYPTYRELGERYGVSHSVIADYAKTRNIQRRRKEAQARVLAKAEQKMVELRATAIAYSKDDELRIIDGYLAGFERAITEGRVRFDNPADFNTMVRLKEFVQGNADSRQEIHASLSLETLQSRHRQMIRAVDVTPEERGVVGALPAQSVETSERVGAHPPAPPIEGAAQEPAGRFLGRFGPSGAPREEDDAVASAARIAGDVAPARPATPAVPSAGDAPASGDVAASLAPANVCASGAHGVPSAQCSSAGELGSARPTEPPSDFRGLPPDRAGDDSLASEAEAHAEQGDAARTAVDDALADTLRAPPRAPGAPCE